MAFGSMSAAADAVPSLASAESGRSGRAVEAPPATDRPEAPAGVAALSLAARDTDGLGERLALLRTIRTSLVLLAVISSAVAFYFGKDILVPVALGLLITLTLTPPVRWLRARGLPAALAAVSIVLGVAGAIGIGAWFLGAPVNELIESAPRTLARIRDRLAELQASAGGIDEVTRQVDEMVEGSGEAQTRVVLEQPGLLSSAASSLASGMTSLAVALVFALFMLASGDLFYQKLVSVMPALSDKKRALRVVRDVEANVSRYLFTITLINAALGLVVGSLLHLWGMPGATLWGVIAAVLNFLPFVGALIGAGLLGAISLGQYDGLWAALVPPAIYLGCSTLEGNVLTPMIVGRRLELNTVAVFLAVAVWGWLWGIAGALMAVPMLVVFKVLCDHVDALHGWGEFLAGKRVPPRTSANLSLER